MLERQHRGRQTSQEASRGCQTQLPKIDAKWAKHRLSSYDLLLTNDEVVGSEMFSRILGFSDHETMTFKMLRGARKVSSRA